MKAARFVLKVVAVSMGVFYAIADKIKEKKADCRFASEYDDYDDSVL